MKSLVGPTTSSDYAIRTGCFGFLHRGLANVSLVQLTLVKRSFIVVACAAKAK